MKDSIIKNKNRIISYIFWLFIWMVIDRVVKNPILFPSPLKVFNSIIYLSKTHSFYLNILTSMLNIGAGLILGIFIGFILGCISYKYTYLKDIIILPINLMKSIPIASIVVILLVWLEARELPIIVIMLIVIPNIYYSVYEALNNVDKDLIELSTVYNISEIKVFRYIYVPKIKEFLIPSIIVSTGLAWKSGISAEVMGLVNNTIGENIYYSKLYLDTSELFAWTIVIIIISKIFESLITRMLMKVK